MEYDKSEMLCVWRVGLGDTPMGCVGCSSYVREIMCIEDSNYEGTTSIVVYRIICVGFQSNYCDYLRVMGML